jgi:hypothetical protein
VYLLEVAGGAEDCVASLAEDDQCPVGGAERGQRGQQRLRLAVRECEGIDDRDSFFRGAGRQDRA